MCAFVNEIDEHTCITFKMLGYNQSAFEMQIALTAIQLLIRKPSADWDPDKVTMTRATHIAGFQSIYVDNCRDSFRSVNRWKCFWSCVSVSWVLLLTKDTKSIDRLTKFDSFALMLMNCDIRFGGLWHSDTYGKKIASDDINFFLSVIYVISVCCEFVLTAKLQLFHSQANGMTCVWAHLPVSFFFGFLLFVKANIFQSSNRIGRKQTEWTKNNAELVTE